MSRRRLVAFVLLLAACGLCVAVLLVLKERRSARTFVLATNIAVSSKAPWLSGGYVNVILTERLPGGQTQTRVVLESVYVIDDRDCTIADRPLREVTLLVSNAEAEIVEQANRRGAITLRRVRDPKPMLEKWREALFGEPAIRGEDIMTR